MQHKEVELDEERIKEYNVDEDLTKEERGLGER